MIQRIQTVFLIIATILLAFMLFMPIAEVVRPMDEAVFGLGFNGLKSAEGAGTILSSYPLSILIALCLTLCIVTIFLFKKRMLQIRLSVANSILLLGLQGLAFYYVKSAETVLEGDGSYTLIFTFPLVSAILVFLALRAIARDEALVRSLNRLR